VLLSLHGARDPGIKILIKKLGGNGVVITDTDCLVAVKGPWFDDCWRATVKRVFYSGGSIITGSEIADALLSYAMELSMRRLSDVIEVPVLDDSGDIQLAKLLISPASQLFAVEVDVGCAELRSDRTIATLDWTLRRHSIDTEPSNDEFLRRFVDRESAPTVTDSAR